jgi:hypothetical protein
VSNIAHSIYQQRSFLYGCHPELFFAKQNPAFGMNVPGTLQDGVIPEFGASRTFGFVI